jgi:anti-sigma B factor antagonist
MPDQATRLKITRFGGTCIVEIQEELNKLVDGEGAGALKMLLSFANVEHMSSAALGMLITLNKRVKEKGGQLKLSDIKPQIFEVFKITRLNQMFSIYDTIKQARESFS